MSKAGILLKLTQTRPIVIVTIINCDWVRINENPGGQTPISSLFY